MEKRDPDTQVPDTVTLLLDNDETIECMILCILPAGGREYIALLPMTGEDAADIDDEESPVYIYRYTTDESGEPQLVNIEDDEEYEIAADAYDEWLDTLEYDGLDLNALGLDPLE